MIQTTDWISTDSTCSHTLPFLAARKQKGTGETFDNFLRIYDFSLWTVSSSIVPYLSHVFAHAHFRGDGRERLSSHTSMHQIDEVKAVIGSLIKTS